MKLHRRAARLAAASATLVAAALLPASAPAAALQPAPVPTTTSAYAIDIYPTGSVRAAIGDSVQISISVDRNPNPYYVTIWNQTRGVAVRYCAFYEWGACYVDVSESTPSTQTYFATVSDYPDTYPPPNIQGTSATVSVTWYTPVNAGTGAFTGSATWSGPGIAPPGVACGTSSFNMSGTMSGTVLDLRGSAALGNLNVTAWDWYSSCEEYYYTSRAIYLTLSGTSVTGGTISCPLRGWYNRDELVMSLQVEGQCTVNSLPSEHVVMIGPLQIIPTDPGATVTTGINNAQVVGTPVLIP